MTARLANRLADRFGQVSQVHVARRDGGPGVDHPDHRLVEIAILHAGGAQHGAGRRAGRSCRDGV